jgi:hypothetical protein
MNLHDDNKDDAKEDKRLLYYSQPPKKRRRRIKDLPLDLIDYILDFIDYHEHYDNVIIPTFKDIQIAYCIDCRQWIYSKKY